MHHRSFCWRNQTEPETLKFRENKKSSVPLVRSGTNTLGWEHDKAEKRYFPLLFLPSIYCFSDHEQTLSSPWDHQDQVFPEIPSGQIDPEIHVRTVNSVSVNLCGAAYKQRSPWIQGARDGAVLTEAQAAQEESSVSQVTPHLTCPDSYSKVQTISDPPAQFHCLNITSETLCMDYKSFVAALYLIMCCIYSASSSFLLAMPATTPAAWAFKDGASLVLAI